MLKKHKRNDSLIDTWSFVHLITSGVLAWWMGPLPAFIIVTLWEPFEIFVLSPLLAKKGIVFGYETWRNSLSDIFFNGLGIGIAVAIQAM